MQRASIQITPRQIALVRESFAKIVPIREAAAALFYSRLFASDPGTRPLFRGDIKSQGVKLIAAIGTVVKSLDRIETMLDDLRALARRHHHYGVREEHYASVGAALLWTLEQGLGPDFTPDVREAWAAAYELLSGAMIAVSSDHDPTIGTVGSAIGLPALGCTRASSGRTHGGRSKARLIYRRTGYLRIVPLLLGHKKFRVHYLGTEVGDVVAIAETGLPLKYGKSSLLWPLQPVRGCQKQF